MPNLSASNFREETLQDKDPNLEKYPTTEIKVYSRRKPHGNKGQPGFDTGPIAVSRSYS
jgi:hypothetical protein